MRDSIWAGARPTSWIEGNVWPRSSSAEFPLAKHCIKRRLNRERGQRPRLQKRGALPRLSRARMFLSRCGRFAMPTTAYLTLTGKAQGAIKGNVTAKGREGAIALLSGEYELSSPFDATTGLATGKRQHKPI